MKLQNHMGWAKNLGVVFVLVVFLANQNVAEAGVIMSGNSNGSEQWGYADVRQGAHMFWWLYRSPGRRNESWPLILWLQGGPGASGVGIGNFQEIGPLDTNLQPRNSTWLQKADLLFVDSPVGTGFSYVENETLYVKTDREAAEDLLAFLKQFSTTVTDLAKTSLYIVAESYGGKIACHFGLVLSKAIAGGGIKAKLGGVALGDSWISPVDFVNSWGPLLKAVSRLDERDADEVNKMAEQIQKMVESGRYLNATASWTALENFIDKHSNNVDFYNFLLDSGSDPLSLSATNLQSLKMGTPAHILQYLSKKDDLKQINSADNFDSFMNSKIREKLKIIPKDVRWGGQSDFVFDALEAAFMVDAISEVDELLARGEKVIVYNGQLDLICATLGTEAWVQKLRWKGLKEYYTTKRTALHCAGSEKTKGFHKSYENLQFFWILKAGHFVPVDQPCAALNMLDMIFGTASLQY